MEIVRLESASLTNLSGRRIHFDLRSGRRPKLFPRPFVDKRCDAFADCEFSFFALAEDAAFVFGYVFDEGAAVFELGDFGCPLDEGGVLDFSLIRLICTVCTD